MNIVLGMAIAFVVGLLCRLLQLPVPAPANFLGVLLIACVTGGYLTAPLILNLLKF